MYVHGEVELTGRNVKETIMASAVQIRDISAHFFPGNAATYPAAQGVDVTSFLDKGVHIYNQLDQAVNVVIYGDIGTGSTAGNFTVVASESLAAGAKKWFGVSGYAALKDSFSYLVLQVTSTVAPVSGSITAKFQGGPR